MLSIKHKFIFIHIPKTGGNSIHNALRSFSEDQVVCKSAIQDGIERFEIRHSPYNSISKHSTLREYFDELSTPLLDSCKIFTCIRNPWDRMVSYYFSPHRRVTSWCRDSFIEMLTNETQSSEQYLINKHDVIPTDIHYLRFERLSKDFVIICKSLGINEAHLPHYNASVHGDYRQYYDQELIQLVAQKSRFETEVLGYEF